MPQQPSTEQWIEYLAWNQEDLIPVVTQESASGRILTLAWMNRAALAETVATGHAVYWSRSRNRLWHKGEESGHYQYIEEIRTDCDRDSLLITVRQEGGIACHTGRHSCFYLRLEDRNWQPVDPVLRDPGLIYKKS